MKWLVRLMIHLYRLCISPLLGDCCRFYPTCSEYALEAFSKKRFLEACWLTFKRIMKCGPWHRGGHDFLPK
ncbi:MAG: membrane protein insertion efficiency factor YidD [Chlamydiia bacterium]|nr:membrane protein insertion efficiency factor YidD [Chlamydiia bacterium]